MTRKFKKAEFTYEDYLENMSQVKNMGNIPGSDRHDPGNGKSVEKCGSERQ